MDREACWATVHGVTKSRTRLKWLSTAHLHIWGYWYFSWQSWFQLVVQPAWNFTWCTLHISWISRVTTYSLDLFLAWFGTSLLSTSGSNCCFLICIEVSQEAGKVIWYSHLFKNFPQFVVIYTVRGFGVINNPEVDVFLELSCFFNDPTDVCNLISDSSAFSKTSLNIWKFSVHILLNPHLQNFNHYFASMWNKCNCAAV